MKESEKRIDYIADYISAYEEKIKLLNVNGLFDAAKLFELFAIEVGGLYLGQELSNLNIDTYTYPCVDLISSDKQTFIQVSTTKDIPGKIKTTLENIRDSKREDINTITNVKFIMLNNDSVDKVKDYVGDNQIGSTPFSKVKNLITTRDILQKAISNLDFQIALYELLKKENESIKLNSIYFEDTIESSKTIGLGNIDCKINNEYRIDRSELITLIEADDHKNISIQGRAGCGKSALCKMLVENKKNVIYARAERFLEETDINKIWGFNVSQTLEYLNGEHVIFLIDSLEFIADIPTKLDLLQALYECTRKHINVQIITSCRTSDRNAFMRIENNYSVRAYEIPVLTYKEQCAIAEKYPIIKKMLDMNAYAELLKSPFYINLTITKIRDINNIVDENELREYIWKHVICLNDNKIKDIIESIVISRAQSFLLGVLSDRYDSGIIEKLISNDVLISNGNIVRLRYDIFEDICFEQYFDKRFYECRGDFNVFFEKIESLGRCIYRRYQIWISNKLLAKQNRDKFLFELVFSEKMPQNWKKQTIIGLVKSRYCKQFFEENCQSIIDSSNTLDNFIKTTNLFAFEIDSNFSQLLSFIQLRPSGQGRQSLIHLIFTANLYKGDMVSKTSLEKLCSDYSNSIKKDKTTAKEACVILEYLIEKCISETQENDYYKIDDDINRLLVPVYRMAESSKEWIKGFWTKLSSFYQDTNGNKNRLASDIIGDTIKFHHNCLAQYLPIELCNLAELYWTISPPRTSFYGFYGMDRHEISYEYGLNENANNYEHDSTRSTVLNSNFFFVLFQLNFWKGIKWSIEFVNKAVLAFAEKHPDLPKHEITFIEANTKKSYYGYENMWLVTAQEYNMPMIISDLIFCLKEVLRNVINNDSVVDKKTSVFVENVAKYIYKNSNNIAMLSVISDIGLEFANKIPGLALDLATNIDIIIYDLTKSSKLNNHPYLQMLQKQIFLSMGMPYVPSDRYNKTDSKQYDLQTYVIESQLYGSVDIQKKCHSIIDYLYSTTKNDEQTATEHLQIQKMDMRIANAMKIDDTTIALMPTITGEAKKVIEDNDKRLQPNYAVASLIKSCKEKLNKNNFQLGDCLEAIDKLLTIRNKCATPEMYDEVIIDLIAYALRNNGLDDVKRIRFCQMWVDRIDGYFSNKSFIFKYDYSIVLFEQIETNISIDVKNRIKLLILDLILYEGSNGVVSQIAHYARAYLQQNEQLTRAIFHTTIKISEDEMNHQKFNAEYIRKHRQKETFKFSPNMQPRLSGVDHYIKEDNRQKYQSKKSEIISKYLFNYETLDLSNFDTNHHDISILCYAVNCGLSLNDADIVKVSRSCIICLVDVWKTNQKSRDSHKILGVYPLYQIMEFFQRELIAGGTRAINVFDILFTDIDFSKFTRDTIKFYLDIFGALLAEYFDAHSDKERRANCVEIIHLLENRIVSISEEKVKLELYKSLTLTITTYGGSGDWSKCQAGYSYHDKQFLNEVFSKYGGYHLIRYRI